MRQDSGTDVTPVHPRTDGSVDLVAHPRFGNRPGPAVGHEDLRRPAYAVDTRVTASSVRIDGPAEGHARSLGHPIECGFRPNFVEADVHRLGCVEGPDRRRIAEAGEGPAALFVDG